MMDVPFTNVAQNSSSFIADGTTSTPVPEAFKEAVSKVPIAEDSFFVKEDVAEDESSTAADSSKSASWVQPTYGNESMALVAVSDRFLAHPAPENDKGCSRKKSKCEPEQFCFFKRGWFEWRKMLNADKACYLKVDYYKDSALSAKFMDASLKPIIASYGFAQKGGFLKLRALKKSLKVGPFMLGDLITAKDSKKPDQPDHTEFEALVDKWETANFEEYAKKLTDKKYAADITLLREKLDAATSTMSLSKLMMKNIETGWQKTRWLKKAFPMGAQKVIEAAQKGATAQTDEEKVKVMGDILGKSDADQKLVLERVKKTKPSRDMHACGGNPQSQECVGMETEMAMKASGFSEEDIKKAEAKITAEDESSNLDSLIESDSDLEDDEDLRDVEGVVILIVVLIIIFAIFCPWCLLGLFVLILLIGAMGR